MLVRFNVGNFLSFKDVQEFSLIKGKIKNKSERIYENGQVKLLKFSSIFGANASGKSNLVKSIMYAQRTILDDEQKRDRVSSFKLDTNFKNKSSYFEFEIIVNNKNYSYGFEIILDKNEFVSEWLIELGVNGSEKNIFTRDILQGEFTSELNIKTTGLKKKFEVYSDDIKNNKKMLFLTEMNRAKTELYKEKNEFSIFKEVFTWFKEKLDVNYPDRPISDYSYFSNIENKDEICKVISALGTGITNYNIVKSSLEQIQKILPEELYNKLKQDLYSMKLLTKVTDKIPQVTIRVEDMYYVISLNNDNEIDVTTIIFNHGNTVEFDFKEESDGTRRILDLIEILFSDQEKIYVIDELDRSLHPQLTYKFVKEYLEIAKKKNIQLVITTHESRLLDFGLLRQDEIWIAEKNSKGETQIYSLDEYNVRFDQKVDKAYLEGRYGGVPIFSSIFPIREE